MFCIMRTEKRKRTDITGIQKENNRTATGYNNSVNRERSELNVPLIQSNNWTQDIKAEIDRAGAHTRSNSVVALDTLYTASPQFFDDKTQEQTEHFFKECLQFHQERFGHIISAVIHYDETTPHLHVVSVPLTQDGRLSARDVIGNRAKMSRTQDMFYEQVGKVYGLDRGERGDGQEKKEHTSAQEHKLSARASSLYVQTVPKDGRIIGRFSYCFQHGEGIVNPTCCLCHAALNLIPLFITVILLFIIYCSNSRYFAYNSSKYRLHLYLLMFCKSVPMQYIKNDECIFVILVYI